LGKKNKKRGYESFHYISKKLTEELISTYFLVNTKNGQPGAKRNDIEM